MAAGCGISQNPTRQRNYSSTKYVFRTQYADVANFLSAANSEIMSHFRALFAKLRKATINFVMSVRRSVHI